MSIPNGILRKSIGKDTQDITLFASSDYQLSPNNQGEYNIPKRKEGHIQGIIKRAHELKALNHITGFLNPGDLTNSGSSGSFLDFQFYKSQKNPLGFGISDELTAFKQKVVKPFTEAGLDDFQSVGNHDVPQTNWSNFLGFLSRQTEKAIKTVSNRNVDIPTPNLPRQAVTDYIKNRYGGEFYYRSLGAINVVSLGLYPNQKALSWMDKNVPKDKPVVLFWHYNVKGPFSVEGSFGGPWWSKNEREYAFDFLKKNYHSLAIIVGHYHTTTGYKFQDIPIFVVGGGQFLELKIEPQNEFKLSHRFHLGAENEMQDLNDDEFNLKI